MKHPSWTNINITFKQRKETVINNEYNFILSLKVFVFLFLSIYIYCTRSLYCHSIKVCVKQTCWVMFIVLSSNLIN